MWSLHCVLETTECCFDNLISVKAQTGRKKKIIINLVIFHGGSFSASTLQECTPYGSLRSSEWRQRIISS